jgi:hypothetical protein
MTSMHGASGSGTGPAPTITEQINAIERELAASCPAIDLSNPSSSQPPPGRPAVLDLSNASGAYPRAAAHTARRVRPDEHRTEAEAALSMFEDACDEPGGELASWHLAAAAIVHALLDLGEAVRHG